MNTTRTTYSDSTSISLQANDESLGGNKLGAESIALHDDVARLYPSGGLSVDLDLFEQKLRLRAEAPITRHRNDH
jgi:hypothetical protein